MIELRAVTARYGPVLANDRLDLTVHRGELLTLLGPSGCGKTTALRTLTGHVRPESGRVVIDGRDVTDLPTHRRELGMVFQNFALFPHMTVRDNVGFPLMIRGDLPDRAGDRWSTEALRLVRLEGHAEKHPRQLSGGQQQRVGLARALVYRPKVLLLDEPLSNLDAKLREEMRFEIREVVTRLGVTAVYVTHDQEEALALSDRIAIMHRGRIEQLGTPEDIYARPASRFVAEFVGLSSFLDGRGRGGRRRRHAGRGRRRARDCARLARRGAGPARAPLRAPERGRAPGRRRAGRGGSPGDGRGRDLSRGPHGLPAPPGRRRGAPRPARRRRAPHARNHAVAPPASWSGPSPVGWSAGRGRPRREQIMTSTSVSRIANLTMEELAAALASGRWLLLPFGTVEAHGPHLALGADLVDAARICGPVAERVGGLVAPAFPYGVCRTMRNFPGTVSLSAATFAAAVREVVQEYVRHGARRLALYSGHAEPGQLEALREAVVPIVDADPALIVLVVGPYAFLDPVREAAGLTGRDGHAASLETSTVLALDASLVRLDRVPDVRERPRLSIFRVAAHPEAEFPAAVRGDTRHVSAELGRRAIDHVVTEFAALLERVGRTGREW